MNSARFVALGVFAASVTIQALIANYVDFYSYLGGVRRAVEIGSPYADFQLVGTYPLGSAAAGRGYVYPPTSLWLLMPFAFDRFGGVALNVVGAMLYASTFLAIVERRVWIGWWAVPLLALLSVAPPMQHAIDVGQVTPLLGAMIGAAWLAPRLSGWLAVLGGMVKVYPALGLAWTYRKGEPIAAPLVAGIAIAGVTAAVWPTAWPDFFVSWLNGEAGCYPWGLPSFACLVPGGSIIGIAVAAVLTVLVVRLRSDEAAYAVLGWAMIAAAPDVYLNYLLIPMMAMAPLVVGLLVRQRQAEPLHLDA